MDKKSLISFVSNVLMGGVVGVIVDYFAKTGIIFTAVGLVIGLVVALIIKNKKS